MGLQPRHPDAPPGNGGGRHLPFAFALIFCALFVLHAPLLRLPYFWDEAGYFVPAARDILLTGKLIPQTTLSNAHPPLVMLWLAAWWKLSGYTPAVTRTAMLLLAAFGLLGVYRLAERVANRRVALASLALSALYPVIFTQSSLAQLDMAVLAFTMWALYFYINGRRAASIGFSALATLSKETAFITPLAFLLWEVVCHMRRRSPESSERGDSDYDPGCRSEWARQWCLHCDGLGAAFAQLLAAAPLALWYAYHYLRTGRLFGPEYFSYNVSSTITPLRIPLALLNRLWDATGYMNLFMLTAAALVVWRFAPAIPDREARGSTEGRTNLRETDGRIMDRRVQALFFLLIAAYVVMLSMVGGAALARYLIPVIPLVVISSVATLYRNMRLWWAWCLVCAAAFVLALVVSPPWRIAPEDNLSYARFVRLHEAAAVYLERHYGHDRILTAWPASDELNRPFLGYVSEPLTVTRIENFSPAEVLKAAQQRQSFDVVFVFSTKYDPPTNFMRRFRWWDRLQERYFDYHSDLSPALTARLLRGRVVWRKSAGAEWAAIIELDEIRNARLRQRDWPPGPLTANWMK